MLRHSRLRGLPPLIAVGHSNLYGTQPREIPAAHNFARIEFTALANNVTAILAPI